MTKIVRSMDVQRAAQADRPPVFSFVPAEGAFIGFESIFPMVFWAQHHLY